MAWAGPLAAAHPASAITGHAQILQSAGYRRGGSAEADLLRRSLARMHPRVLRSGVAGQEDLDAVAAATADPSFSFLDALSVAAWGRVPRSGAARQTRERSRSGS